MCVNILMIVGYKIYEKRIMVNDKNRQIEWKHEEIVVRGSVVIQKCVIQLNTRVNLTD